MIYTYHAIFFEYKPYISHCRNHGSTLTSQKGSSLSGNSGWEMYFFSAISGEQTWEIYHVTMGIPLRAISMLSPS